MPRGGGRRSKPASLKRLEGDRRKVGRAKFEEVIEGEPKAREALAKTGKLVQGSEGPIINPYWRIWRQAANDARMMGGELGLSPSSRARLSVEADKEPDPMELLLGMEGDPAFPLTGKRQ
jgi:hypothetical protein